jgi:KaiC/GvpD/RAD55 family RecA-like ATPase
LEAVKVGDVDAEMELRAEIAGRFRRNDAQVDAALFRLLTEQEAGPKKTESSDSVDLRTVQGLDYLVDGFLPANGLTLAYGSKGAGKTTAAVALGFSVVEGRGFLDHSKPAPAGRVLFVASDSGAGPLRTVIQEMGYGDHEALTPGEGQRFFVWAHEADQGHSAWDVSVRGCVKLLQFVKEKGISLVVIDSAKAVCAKAGLSYTDNDAVNALLTFMKEVITPHASVLFLSHDGTAVGSHAGAKAWAEIVDVVHRQTRPEGDHRSRTWTVVKNRLGPTREFSYSLDEGELVLAQGVETIGDASSAVLKVLREAHERDKDKLSRKGIHEEVFKRFDFAPKTIDNTLQRLVQGKAPKVVRKGKGFYALSPKELYRGCLVNGEEWTLSPVPDCDLPITRALPEGNDGRFSDCPPVPEAVPVGNSRVMTSSLGTTEETGDSSPRGTHPLKEDAPGIFDSVEIFQAGEWRNGWWVADDGEVPELVRSDDPEQTLRLDWSLVRPCRS